MLVRGWKSNKIININKKGKQMTMKNNIINYIRAGYPGLYLVSPEEKCSLGLDSSLFRCHHA